MQTYTYVYHDKFCYVRLINGSHTIVWSYSYTIELSQRLNKGLFTPLIDEIYILNYYACQSTVFKKWYEANSLFKISLNQPR